MKELKWVRSVWDALKFHNDGIKFIHNITYPDLGRKRFDFHLIDKNEYIEVTSFNSQYGRFEEYMKNIEIKRKHVENVLKAKFTFIQRTLSRKEKLYVRNNLKKDKQSKYPLFTWNK